MGKRQMNDTFSYTARIIIEHYIKRNYAIYINVDVETRWGKTMHSGVFE